MVGLGDVGNGVGDNEGEGASRRCGRVRVRDLLARMLVMLADHGRALAPVLRIDRVAEWLDVSERAVRKMMDRGEIPWAWQGRQRVVPTHVWLDRLAAEARKNDPPHCGN
jgi:hypothetical protein